MSKNLLFFLLAFFIGHLSCSGQQDFKFNYNFKKTLDETNFRLYKFDIKSGKYVQKDVSDFGKIKGTLKEMSIRRDTLKVRLWPNSFKTTVKTKLNEEDNYNDFIITLPKDNKSGKIANYPEIKDYEGFDLPFRSWEIMAITIPLKVNMNNGTISDEFINANVSVSKILGKNRVYRSEFVSPRPQYFGTGLFLGLGGTTNTIEKKEVGLNYGINIIGSIYNVNLIVAIGLESGLSKYGKTNPFLGFGFGFDLFSINAPTK